jgi:agarase
MTVDTSAQFAQKYIRVVQDDGIWWFEDGEGRKFFSLGVNCIGGCFGHAEDTPLSPGRKRRIEASLRNWGFNTAGAWSSPSVLDGHYVADQIYPEFFETHDDVFDPSLWNDRLTEVLRREVEPFLGRKHFVGYFLDNEREWDTQGVFEFYLRLPPGTPGSRAFTTFLERHYQEDIHRLNIEWGTAHPSFAHIAATDPPASYLRSMQWGLLKVWRVEVATTYYRRYATIIRALDPDHLILGIRYRGVPERDLCVALSPYFDVNSINDYNRHGHLKAAYAELYEATGKPLMITEFSFSGFPQPGRLSDLFVEVYSQENRGLGYRKYVQQAAQAPFMVGMHWFMWRDYPSDEAAQVYPYPPDQNVGLVSGDDARTYAELTDAVSQTNAAVEAIHRHAGRPPSAAPLLQSWALRRFLPTADGHLAEWPEELTLRPTTVQALTDHHGRGPQYFLSWDEHALYLAAEVSSAS